MHMMKATDEHFVGFGEIYFSCSWPGAVKAWHIHKTMTIKKDELLEPIEVLKLVMKQLEYLAEETEEE